MSINRSMNCGSCNHEIDCPHLLKLEEVAESIYCLSSRAVNDMPFPSYNIYISDSDDIDCRYVSSALDNSICISCGTIKKWPAADIRKLFLAFLNRNSASCETASGIDNNDIDDEPEDGEEGDNGDDVFLTPAAKIETIQKILEIDKPITIINSNQINAYADGDERIYITSAAVDLLDLDEIAFGLAHEDGHIALQHIKQRQELVDKIARAVKSSWQESGGFWQKLLDTIKIGAVGFVASVGLDQIQEIQADIAAQKKLDKVGYGQDGGEKFFTRIDNGFSLGHPSSKARKEIIKRTKSGR